MKQISSRELSEWMLFEEQAGPLGSSRLDHHLAQLNAEVVNLRLLIVSLFSKDKPPWVEPVDFLPWLDEDSEFGEAADEDDPEALMAADPGVQAFEAMMEANKEVM